VSGRSKREEKVAREELREGGREGAHEGTPRTRTFISSQCGRGGGEEGGREEGGEEEKRA